MNVIQVYQTNPFKEGQGGGVRYVKNLLSGIKSNVDSILFLGIGNKKERKDNIELFPVTKDMTGYIKFLFFLIIKLPFMDLSKYNIVHVHRLYFAIPFIIFKPRLKIVCSLHGRTFSVFESNNGSLKLKLLKPFFKIIEKFSIKNIDYLVPVSQDVIESFNDKYKGFKYKSNISIASPMIDFDDYKIFEQSESKNYFSLEAKYNYLGFLGRLSDVKDISFLIRLVSLKKDFFMKNKLKLAIFGDGESKLELEELVKSKELTDIVLFLGEIDPGDIDKVLASIEILLLSSKHESGPIVMKEAILCGIPVITNNVGEVSDYIINEKNGFIVEKDYTSYFSAIKSLLNMSLSKDDIINNSQKQLQKCSVEYISKKYIEVYKKVLK